MLNILAQNIDSITRFDPEKVIALGGGFFIAALAILCGTISSVMRQRQREQSRREIAAYVAEGSITPEDGAKLIAAGKKSDGCEG